MLKRVREALETSCEKVNNLCTFGQFFTHLINGVVLISFTFLRKILPWCTNPA